MKTTNSQRNNTVLHIIHSQLLHAPKTNLSPPTVLIRQLKFSVLNILRMWVHKWPSRIFQICFRLRVRAMQSWWTGWKWRFFCWIWVEWGGYGTWWFCIPHCWTPVPINTTSFIEIGWCLRAKVVIIDRTGNKEYLHWTTLCYCLCYHCLLLFFTHKSKTKCFQH